jgi:hypothetical protein
MSYCRFQNTLRNLDDCEQALADGIDRLSEDERRAALDLIQKCQEIIEDYGYELE